MDVSPESSYTMFLNRGELWLLLRARIEILGHLWRAPKANQQSAQYVANRQKKESARHVRIRSALKPWRKPPEKRQKRDGNLVEGDESNHRDGDFTPGSDSVCVAQPPSAAPG
jgi:hypothetical protein